MYNKVILIGNLTRDVEMRYLPSGAALAKLGLATNRRFKGQGGEDRDETCFVDINIFGRSAEVANQYLRKGSKVLIEGRLVFESWTDPQGQKRNKHSVTCESMKMLDSRGQGGGGYTDTDDSYGSQPGNQNYNNQNPSYGNYGAAGAGAAAGGAVSQPQGNNQDGSQNLPEIDINDDEIPF